jgi:hypothetical protein
VALLSCFVLVVPVLLLNLLLTGRLPRTMFGRDVFWHHIPPVIAYGENLLRVVIIAVPLFIPLRWRPVGLAVYAVGLALYVGCWVALIGWPVSAWSTSAAGLLAPAYTPFVWAMGIGLIGQPQLGHYSLPGWLYPASAALFTAFHLTHVAIVYHRVSG